MHWFLQLLMWVGVWHLSKMLLTLINTIFAMRVSEYVIVFARTSAGELKCWGKGLHYYLPWAISIEGSISIAPQREPVVVYAVTADGVPIALRIEVLWHVKRDPEAAWQAYQLADTSGLAEPSCTIARNALQNFQERAGRYTWKQIQEVGLLNEVSRYIFQSLGLLLDNMHLEVDGVETGAPFMIPTAVSQS